MKFGLRYANTGPYIDPARAVELAQAGEEAGFESIWTVDHVVVPAGYRSTYPYAAGGRMAGGDDAVPIPEPLIWMAWVASATTSIKLGTGVLILPQRNPVVTAKAVGTLDFMSGGRVLLGVGVGWLEEEFEALGADFAQRGPITDEYIAALRVLWRDERPTFDGEFVSFDGAYCRPQPPGGSVPIIIGGHSKAAARRAGRLGDGFFPARGAPQELIELVRQSATQSGRDPDSVEITTGLPDDLTDIPELAARGVSRLLVPTTTMAGLPTRVDGPDGALAFREVIERYAD